MKRPSSEGCGILLVAHGERGGAGTNTLLQRLARDVGARLEERIAVRAGVLNGAPSLEAAIADHAAAGCGDVLVYPVFMADGYFTRTRLPDSLDAACRAAAITWRMLPPLGLDDGLPPLIETGARNEAERAGLAMSDTRLLLVGHGSEKSPASADATRAVATAMHRRTAFGLIDVAFLEEPPFLADKIAGAWRDTLVVGLFSGEGLHANEDVPAALADTRHRYLGAVTNWPGIADLVADSLRSALTRGTAVR